MKLKCQLLIRCLSAAALLLGLFGTLMIQLFFRLQLSREQDALSAQSAALAQSLEAAAVNYALQSIPLSDELLCELLTSLNSSAALYAQNGMPLDKSSDSSPLTHLAEGICHQEQSLCILRSVHLRGEICFLRLTSSLEVLYENRTVLLIGYCALYTLLIGIFALVMLFTAHRIAQPIERLSFVSRRLSEGEMKLRAEESGTEEILSLSRSFNQMADALTGQIERQNRFIADLTHEMKTPLTAMIGHADLIRSGRLEAENVQLSAHQIVKEGQRLNTLCTRLIDLILLKNDSIHSMSMLARSLLEDAASAFEPDAQAKNISLSIDCDDALLTADPILMRLLVNNLIDNALKSDAHHVRLEGRLLDGRFTLRVCDDGCGMDEVTLSHITEPFYRADKSRSRLQGGAGLGLALCAQIAELHGTFLSFESSPGCGTTVCITIPGEEVMTDAEET